MTPQTGYRWNRNARVNSDTVKSFARIATLNGMIAMVATAVAIGLINLSAGLLVSVPTFTAVWLLSMRSMTRAYVTLNEEHYKALPPTPPGKRPRVPVYSNGKLEMYLDE